MSQTRSLPVGLVESLGLLKADEASWWRKYSYLKRNSQARAIECLLSFRQYLQLAKRAGVLRPSMIGCKSDKYQVGRIGDTGNYEIGNCRFITMAQNQHEKVENGGDASGIALRVANNKSRDRASFVRRSENFELCSPNGKIHTGTNLRAFCAQYDIHFICLAAVCRGSRKSHKGWTGKYLR
jgi:hypothetical protein